MLVYSWYFLRRFFLRWSNVVCNVKVLFPYHNIILRNYRDYVDYYGASRHRSYYYNTSTDYSRPYEQNPDASLSSIYAYLHLNGTAEGMAEKISEEIEDYLLDNDYNISKGNYTRDDHWIEIDTEGDSYITIRTRFYKQ